MPKGVFASNSTDYNQNERFIHLNSPLNVMINYNYLIETSKGTPITVDLHNDSDTTLKNKVRYFTEIIRYCRFLDVPLVNNIFEYTLSVV